MITKLTPAQEKLLEEYRVKWFDIGTSTEPADRPRAEAAITELFKLDGHEPPTFFWVDSPREANRCINVMEALEEWGSKLDTKRADDNAVKYRLPSNLTQQILAFDALPGFKRMRMNPDEFWPRFWATVEGHGRDMKVKNTTSYWGQMDSYWVAFYLFGEEIGVNYDSDSATKLHLYSEIAQSCGWWWPFEGVVVVSERLAEVHWNSADPPRVHRLVGPAIKFRDGWEIFAMNGILVPREIGEPEPEDVDIRIFVTADLSVDVRREALRKVGVGRVLEVADARELDRKVVEVAGQEHEYILWSLDLNKILDDGVDERAIALQMSNPSVPGVFHLETVPPNYPEDSDIPMETVEQALEYRNGRGYLVPTVLT